MTAKKRIVRRGPSPLRGRPHPSNRDALFARQIRRLVRCGHNAREIGERLGIPQRRVHRIAERQGIGLTNSFGERARAIHVPLPMPAIAALDAVAGGARVDRVEMARRILKVALDDGGKAAIRLLGPQAQPKRVRLTRAEREAQQAAQWAARTAAEAERRRHDDERARAEAAALAARIASIPAEVKDAIAAGLHPLRAVRQHLGLRQVDVAERAGMGAYGDTSVGELERGGRPLTPRMAARLAKAIGVDEVWLRAHDTKCVTPCSAAPHCLPDSVVQISPHRGKTPSDVGTGAP